MRLRIGNSYLPTLRSIRVLEQTGKIAETGKNIFEKICQFMNKNSQILPEYIHVNLSCRQMDNIKNAEELIAIAKRYDISPRKINFEITETEDNDKESIRFVNRLLREGYSFSLDDFGNQYSNCSRLILYPVCVIKTDKTMIDAALTNKKAEIILKSIFEMTKNAQCETIVEGIEKTEQADLDFLKKIDYFQGYAFAKPMPEEEYIKFLKAQQRGIRHAK